MKFTIRPPVSIPDIPFHEFVLDRLALFGNDVAMIENNTGSEITYQQIIAQTNHLAEVLWRRGLRKGDVMAVMLENGAHIIIIELAAMKCGGVVTACNVNFTERETKHQMETSCAKFAFLSDKVSPELKDSVSKLNTIKEVFTMSKSEKYKSFYELMEENTGLNIDVQFDAKKDLVYLPFSSGTTGLPKGVKHTHRSLLSNIYFNQYFPYFRNDTFYVVIPMFHPFGWMMSIICLIQGTKLVTETRFNIEKMFQSIEKYKITAFAAAPPMIVTIMKHLDAKKYNTDSVRKIMCGGATLNTNVSQIKNIFPNAHLGQGWGMSECLFMCLSDFISTPVKSVGTHLPNTLLKVIDIETGKDLDINQTGEICCKGPQVMVGYLNNDEATSKCIDENGWCHTGDIGYFDESGFYYIVDRLKDMIKYKAFQVSPTELEMILIQHPKIIDVVVVGIPDQEAGELPKAFVVRKDGTLTVEEVHKQLEGKVIKYKRLSGGVSFVDSIPKSPSGKILRRLIKQKLIADK